MSVALWIIGWAVVLGTLAFFAVREVCSGRKGPGDFDRTRHEAVQESGMHGQMQGPGSAGMLGGP